MIKFRAYLKGTGVIIDVQEINYKYEEIIYESGKYKEVADFKDIELLQSTGFKDNNDTDIYIGDILEWEAIMGFGWYDKTIDNVIYDENELKIKMNKRDDYSLNQLAVNCEVVGNIYEHSYLLEE